MNELFKNVVHLETHEEIAVITIDRPPVNAMNLAVRSGLIEAVQKSNNNNKIKGICLIGSRGKFISGADITEFNSPNKTPTSVELMTTLENSEKPIIAAIEGMAFGGGLEVALACNYRIAMSGAKLGQLEINLGLIPGAGGTQRLPRIIGFAKAAEMIFSGKPIKAEEAIAEGLVDAVCNSNLLEESKKFLRKHLRGIPPKVRNIKAHKRMPPQEKEKFINSLKKLSGKSRSPLAASYAAKALTAAISLPFDEGLKYERKLFIELRNGPESRAHRHVFFSERSATKRYKGQKNLFQTVTRASIIGAGTMGIGIAMALADSGIWTTISDSNPRNLDKAIDTIKANYTRMVERKIITRNETDKRLALINPTSSIEELGNSEIIIEAVFENLEIKKNVFMKLDNLVSEETILASNTSTLDINSIAEVTSYPENLLGMHFFSPANIMRLIEIVKGKKTNEKTIHRAVEFARQLKKVPVVVGVCDGFVGNRMHLVRSANVERMLQEGALPEEIDRVALNFGFAMGPCATSDLAGLDVAWRIRQSKSITFPVADALVDNGRLGQKTLAGYYLYEKGSRKPKSDPAVADMIKKISGELGIKTKKISDSEILNRLIFPLINEGARILEEKIAESTSDIDVIWINGYGWPAWRGGPMYYANQLGLDRIYSELNQLAQQLSDETLLPANSLKKLAKSGGFFVTN